MPPRLRLSITKNALRASIQLVVPGSSLVVHGPYAVVRHPNYIAVVGELVSMALLVDARVTGPVATLLFSLLLRHRIRVENEALRHLTCS